MAIPPVIEERGRDCVENRVAGPDRRTELWRGWGAAECEVAESYDIDVVNGVYGSLLAYDP